MEKQKFPGLSFALILALDNFVGLYVDTRSFAYSFIISILPLWEEPFLLVSNVTLLTVEAGCLIALRTFKIILQRVFTQEGLFWKQFFFLVCKR